MTTNPNTQSNESAGSLYVAIELSTSDWKLAMTDQIGRRPRIRTFDAGDPAKLQKEFVAAKAAMGLDPDATVVTCYEAGRDGFWIHRCLVSMGAESHIVEPASIQVNRRKRQAKTDRIDAQWIVNALIRFKSGDGYACRMIRVPDREIEDARHLNREMKTIKGERTSHINRIRGLLATQGIAGVTIDRNFPRWVHQVVTGDRKPLGRQLRERLLREFARLQLATEQIRALQMQQVELIRQARRTVARSNGPLAAMENASDRISHIAEHLSLLAGIGTVTASTLAAEVFSWREIRNRKQLAALVGLVPTPHSSGEEEKELGISKSGRGELRVLMIEIAWLWLRYQPGSELSRWYHHRFADGTSRNRKIGIVALARKLLVALGKYIRTGEIPAKARLTNNLSLNYLPSLVPTPA